MDEHVPTLREMNQAYKVLFIRLAVLTLVAGLCWWVLRENQWVPLALSGVGWAAYFLGRQAGLIDALDDQRNAARARGERVR